MDGRCMDQHIGLEIIVQIHLVMGFHLVYNKHHPELWLIEIDKVTLGPTNIIILLRMMMNKKKEINHSMMETWNQRQDGHNRDQHTQEGVMFHQREREVLVVRDMGW